MLSLTLQSAARKGERVGTPRWNFTISRKSESNSLLSALNQYQFFSLGNLLLSKTLLPCQISNCRTIPPNPSTLGLNIDSVIILSNNLCLHVAVKQFFFFQNFSSFVGSSPFWQSIQQSIIMQSISVVYCGSPQTGGQCNVVTLNPRAVALQ